MASNMRLVNPRRFQAVSALVRFGHRPGEELMEKVVCHGLPPWMPG
jgi:hypothetical protein